MDVWRCSPNITDILPADARTNASLQGAAYIDPGMVDELGDVHSVRAQFAGRGRSAVWLQK